MQVDVWLHSIIGLGLAWVALFVYEFLIFILTVFRICKTRGLVRLSLLMSRRNILDVMLQDGMCFVVSRLRTVTKSNAGAMYFA